MKSKRRRTGAAPVEVTAEQRFHLINDVAYFRSLQQRAEPLSADDPAQCWCETEAAIDRTLGKRRPRGAAHAKRR